MDVDCDDNTQHFQYLILFFSMVFSMTNLENLVYKEDHVDILEMFAFF